LELELAVRIDIPVSWREPFSVVPIVHVS
jgi:hypothetical protein